MAAMILLFSASPSVAGKVFDFNAACKSAYQEIILLKLNKGQEIIDEEKLAHPDNLVPHLLENYIDFFTLIFNEDPVKYRSMSPALDKRIALMNEGPVESPFYLFSKSVIYLQWAVIRMKLGYNWDAGWQFRRSYLLIQESREKFPGFAPNLFYDGAMKVAADAIPDGYKWLSNALGVKANSAEGLKQVETFITQDDEWSAFFRTEAVFYYLFLRFYVKNEREFVFDYIRDRQLDLRNNHLFAYMAVNLSLNGRQSEHAIKVITERNTSPDYLQTPIWDLELGYAMMNRLDKDANIYLERFLKNFKGTFYVKDAHQKLSWYYYLQGDQARAEQYRNLSIKKGSVDADADKLAQNDALKAKWPNKLLLKARLLNDGGYFSEALILLEGKKASDFSTPEERLEFLYRAARLYDDTGRDEEAVSFYKKVIVMGEKRREYFAARSAIQLGILFEKKNDTPSALYWYKRCLAMKGHDFKNSLDQRAKAGIARVSAPKQ